MALSANMDGEVDHFSLIAQVHVRHTDPGALFWRHNHSTGHTIVGMADRDDQAERR
jgi:hypothetical protein